MGPCWDGHDPGPRGCTSLLALGDEGRALGMGEMPNCQQRLCIGLDLASGQQEEHSFAKSSFSNGAFPAILKVMCSHDAYSVSDENTLAEPL